MGAGRYAATCKGSNRASWQQTDYAPPVLQVGICRQIDAECNKLQGHLGGKKDNEDRVHRLHSGIGHRGGVQAGRVEREADGAHEDYDQREGLESAVARNAQTQQPETVAGPKDEEGVTVDLACGKHA